MGSGGADSGVRGRPGVRGRLMLRARPGVRGRFSPGGTGMVLSKGRATGRGGPRASCLTRQFFKKKNRRVCLDVFLVRCPEI